VGEHGLVEPASPAAATRSCSCRSRTASRRARSRTC
jgi:hypothetical protein